MAVHKTLTQFGNSLGLLIERPILDLLGIDRTTPLSITTDGKRLVIEPLPRCDQDAQDGRVVRSDSSPLDPAPQDVVRGAPWMGNYAPARLVDPGFRIRILVRDNPKRAGSKSADRFALYRNGMTVSDAYDSGIRPEDVRWDLAHGFIELHRSKYGKPIVQRPS